MAEIYPGWGWSLKVEPKPVDAASEHPTSSEPWRHTDSNGHEHYFDREADDFPTLDYVVDEERLCEDAEDPRCGQVDPWSDEDPSHVPHMVPDQAHFECKLCGEVIEPKSDLSTALRSTSSLFAYTLAGFNSNGIVVVVSLVHAEYERFNEADVADGDPQAEVRRILDEAPTERILSMTNPFGDQPPHSDACINPSCARTGTVLVRWSVGPALGMICADHAVEAMTSGKGQELQGSANGVTTLILR